MRAVLIALWIAGGAWSFPATAQIGPHFSCEAMSSRMTEMVIGRQGFTRIRTRVTVRPSGISAPLLSFQRLDPDRQRHVDFRMSVGLPKSPNGTWPTMFQMRIQDFAHHQVMTAESFEHPAFYAKEFDLTLIASADGKMEARVEIRYPDEPEPRVEQVTLRVKPVDPGLVLLWCDGGAFEFTDFTME